MAGTQSQGEVLVIAGGKGGVGKTNIAVNLGIQLARQGLRTILLDADFGHANADILLNITPRADLVGLLDPNRSVADLLSPGPEGLGVICGITGLRHARRICESDPLLYVGTILRLRRSCDTLIVDCSADVIGAAATFALACDRLILVTTPEPTAVADSYATLKLLFQRGFCARAGVVANMAASAREAVDSVRRLQRVADQFLGISLENLGYLLYDRHVIRSVHAQEPFLIRYPSCGAAKAIERIVERLHPLSGGGRSDAGLWGRVASMFF